MSLLAHYKLNGDATDASGNGHDGAPTDISYSSGKVSQAAGFNGSTSSIDCGADFLGTGDVTVCAWIKLDDWGENGLGRILDNGAFRLYSRGATTNLAYWGSIGTALSGTIALDQWLHVAVTRAADGTVNFYVNGELSGSADQSTSTPVAPTTDVFIGNNSAGNRAFDGLIDDLRVYDAILTPGQIKAIYNEGAGTEAQIFGPYCLEEAHSVCTGAAVGQDYHSGAVVGEIR